MQYTASIIQYKVATRTNVQYTAPTVQYKVVESGGVQSTASFVQCKVAESTVGAEGTVGTEGAEGNSANFGRFECRSSFGGEVPGLSEPDAGVSIEDELKRLGSFRMAALTGAHAAHLESLHLR